MFHSLFNKYASVRLPSISSGGHNKSDHGQGDVEVKIANVDQGDSQVSTALDGNEPSKSGWWKRSFLRLGPLAGISCIILAAGSIIAALGILIGSRDMATTSWSVPPSTYLAICTAIANQALRFAAFQGLAVAWWLRAMRGSSLTQLHRNWRAGITMGGAITSGRHMGLIGVACLASTFVSIDGPLLQKGSTIGLSQISAPPINLNVTMAQELPRDLNGGWYKVGDSLSRWSLNFNKTIPTVHGETTNMIGVQAESGNYGVRWAANAPLVQVIQGCPERKTCKTTIRAPALAVTSCKNHVIPVDYWQHILEPKNIMDITATAPPLSSLAFMVDISLVVGEDKEYINLITGYGRNQNCTGTFNYTICSLESAIGEYEILVSGDKVEMTSGHPDILALANNTKPSHKWNQNAQAYPSTLGGVVELTYGKLESSKNYYVQGSNPIGVGTGFSFQHFTALGTSDGLCWSYRDPFEETLSELNKLMFELGSSTGIGKNAVGKHGNKSPMPNRMDPDLPWDTTTVGYLVGSQEVFESDLRWFAAAAVVEIVCISLILPTYFGWWTLGRSVSLSPLEAAKAFDAPLLAECNSNSSGGDIRKTIGDVRVQYGDTAGGDEGLRKLAFADPAVVSLPKADARFDM